MMSTEIVPKFGGHVEAQKSDFLSPKPDLYCPAAHPGGGRSKAESIIKQKMPGGASPLAPVRILPVLK